jgi:hypothetical protein
MVKDALESSTNRKLTVNIMIKKRNIGICQDYIHVMLRT